MELFKIFNLSVAASVLPNVKDQRTHDGHDLWVGTCNNIVAIMGSAESACWAKFLFFIWPD
jgi:hypothetical protein